MEANKIYADISEAMERIEARALELEENPGDAGALREALDALGLSNLRLETPMATTLVEMVADGVVQPDQATVDVLLGVVEAVKHFLFQIVEQAAGPATGGAQLAADGGAEDGRQEAGSHEAKPMSSGAVSGGDCDMAVSAGSSEPRSKGAPRAGGAGETAGREIDSATGTPRAAAEPEIHKDAARDKPAEAEHGKHHKETATLKVSTDKLDALMNSLKELMITNTMITQHHRVQDAAARDLFNIVLEHGRGMDDLRANVLDIRRVTLHSTMARMGRLARDVAARTGKQVELIAEGGDLQLDKTVADELIDPLTHLVRNAVDHGVESPEERAAAGKPETGRLWLRASSRGDSARLVIEDDGHGLDRDTILKKARERGLAAAGEEPADAEVFHYIMLPGFSTADKISAISGRGVGMDVVAQMLKDMDGSIRIESEKGKGARFILDVPFNRAALEGIADGVLVVVAGCRFVIPARHVVEVRQPRREEYSRMPGEREVVRLRGKALGLYRLDEVFGVDRERSPCRGPAAHEGKGAAKARLKNRGPGGADAKSTGADRAGKSRDNRANDPAVVVVEINGRRRALLVDDVLGEHQVVVRDFDRFSSLFDIRYFSGAALIGDATAVVVDVERMVDDLEPEYDPAV